MADKKTDQRDSNRKQGGTTPDDGTQRSAANQVDQAGNRNGPHDADDDDGGGHLGPANAEKSTKHQQQREK